MNIRLDNELYKRYNQNVGLLLRYSGSVYSELLSFNIKNATPYKNKYANPKLMQVQVTNKVSYCVLLSTRIKTKLLPKGLLRVHKSNT